MEIRQGEQSAEATPQLLQEKRGANVEVYGFVAWIATGLTFVAYVLWAFLSEEWLEWLGVTYYPSKYWATAFPAWLCVSYLFFQFLFYTALNWAFSKPLDSRTTLTDEHTVAPGPDTREGATLVESLMRRREGQRVLAEQPFDDATKGDVPPLCDLPIATVNRLLFPSSPS